MTVHDFDRDGTTVYMTMELLEGRPLNDLIAANAPGGIPKETALPLIRDMGEALAYAHEKGIVHSDFKPGNVFVTDQGELKVLDFGIARAVPAGLQGRGDDTAFDAGDLGALTKTYASAEMLRGEAPSPADDVFALGLVAYELLTGRHAFDRTPADEARREGRTPGALGGVTRRQRNAVASALALDRARRPADARVFLRRLQGPPPVQKALSAAIVLVLAASAAWIYYERAQLRPDVPFESLPAEQQQEFRAAISDGRDALRRGDWALESALTYFSAAYAIHRNNPDAVAGLRATADRFLDATRDVEPALRQRSFDLLLCQEYLSSYDPVLRACRDLLPAGECACASGD